MDTIITPVTGRCIVTEAKLVLPGKSGEETKNYIVGTPNLGQNWSINSLQVVWARLIVIYTKSSLAKELIEVSGNLTVTTTALLDGTKIASRITSFTLARNVVKEPVAEAVGEGEILAGPFIQNLTPETDIPGGHQLEVQSAIYFVNTSPENATAEPGLFGGLISNPNEPQPFGAEFPKQVPYDNKIITAFERTTTHKHLITAR